MNTEFNSDLLASAEKKAHARISLDSKEKEALKHKYRVQIANMESETREKENIDIELVRKAVQLERARIQKSHYSIKLHELIATFKFRNNFNLPSKTEFSEIEDKAREYCDALDVDADIDVTIGSAAFVDGRVKLLRLI